MFSLSQSTSQVEGVLTLGSWKRISVDTPKKHRVRSSDLHITSFPSPVFLLLSSDENWGWGEPLSGGQWTPNWARCASDPRTKQGTAELSICSQALSPKEGLFPHGSSNVRM